MLLNFAPDRADHGCTQANLQRVTYPNICEDFVKDMQHKLLKSLFLAAGLSSTILSAQPVTLDFAPARDNTLYERAAGDLSNGSGENLFFGLTGGNAGMVLRRAVIAFDLSGINPGSVINDVQLNITVNMVPPNAGSFDGTVHRLVSDWGEGSSIAPGAGGSGTSAAPNDATWLHTFFDAQFWNTAGGDFSPASATTNLNNSTGTFTFSSPQLIADVQDMVNNPGGNFGWIILGDEGDAENARRIASRENQLVDSRPVLTIDFVQGPPPPPPPPPLPGTPAAVPALDNLALVILAILMVVSLLIIQRRGD